MNISKCKYKWFPIMTGETIGIVKDEYNQVYIGLAKSGDTNTDIESIILQGNYFNIDVVKSYFD
jgi:hypothetical protein